MEARDYLDMEARDCLDSAARLSLKALYPLMDPIVALIGSFQHPPPQNINEPVESDDIGEYSQWE